MVVVDQWPNICKSGTRKYGLMPNPPHLQILHHIAIVDDERNHSERNTGQKLTARGAPKLFVTVIITEALEKRLSFALEHRIWTVGDTNAVTAGVIINSRAISNSIWHHSLD